MQFGDRNCYFNAFDVPLIDAENPRDLAAKLAGGRADFMILPHHCGYTRGRRGMNWDSFDERNSPIVEIFSNHGSGEADDSPYDYHHTMGPRTGESMVRHGLSLGYRFGFYAGTDSHDGYPGHYGHGCTGVLAPSPGPLERLGQTQEPADSGFHGRPYGRRNVSGGRFVWWGDGSRRRFPPASEYRRYGANRSGRPGGGDIRRLGGEAPTRESRLVRLSARKA